MVVLSKKSKNKKYHMKDCRFIKLMAPSNIKEVGEKEAKRKGYCACDFCNNMKFRFESEKSNIDDYVSKNNLAYRFENNSIYVQSNIAFWRIEYIEKWESFLLYHGNRIPESKEIKLYPKQCYHAQKDAKPSYTIIRYLNYIRKHDDFRSNQIINVENMPKKTKKERAKYNKMKKKERIYNVARVCQILSVMKDGKFNYE